MKEETITLKEEISTGTTGDLSLESSITTPTQEENCEGKIVITTEKPNKVNKNIEHLDRGQALRMATEAFIAVSDWVMDVHDPTCKCPMFEAIQEMREVIKKWKSAEKNK